MSSNMYLIRKGINSSAWLIIPSILITHPYQYLLSSLSAHIDIARAFLVDILEPKTQVLTSQIL